MKCDKINQNEANTIYVAFDDVTAGRIRINGKMIQLQGTINRYLLKGRNINSPS